ncbi:hypothetical protein [Pseudaminobacter salicylatoxidans]|uniref:hypothetical protein n=1 Tax=Pseudaminobacter salicylatoxidans TaxID=93369 RepID=UPI00037E8971|nr:hypothetical protein [Pseudaminobacter salicylatoxidans]
MSACPEQAYIASAAADLGDKLACRLRVLETLETIMQFDSDAALRAQVRRRYCDLTSDERSTA